MGPPQLGWYLTHCILHIASFPLHLSHCIFHIASYTLHLTHIILHFESYTLHLTHCILHIVSYMLLLTLLELLVAAKNLCWKEDALAFHPLKEIWLLQMDLS